MEEKIAIHLEQEQAERQTRQQGLSQLQSSIRSFVCEHCHHSFGRSGDLRRHKCNCQRHREDGTDNRSRSGNSSIATFECPQCSRSFRRSGDLKRHNICDSIKSKKSVKALNAALNLTHFLVGRQHQILMAEFKVQGSRCVCVCV